MPAIKKRRTISVRELTRGDVIRSPRFIHGVVHDGYIRVGFEASNANGEPRWRRCPDATDQSRASARYLVELCEPDQHTGHGREIIARRLKKDGSYDPAGEQIHFFSNPIIDACIGEVEIVGKRTMEFEFYD